MCKFEEIQKANESIITTDIHGKEYAEVNQRVKAFRMVYPNGLIQTDIKSCTDKDVLIMASIYDDHMNMLATGMAHEEKAASRINNTSYIEVCETSAVGRALGFCGFGIDTSIASKEEVENAMAEQEANTDFTEPKKEIVDTGEPITENQLKVLHNLPVEVIANIIEHYKVGALEEMTKAQGIETIKKLRTKTNAKQENKGTSN